MPSSERISGPFWVYETPKIGLESRFLRGFSG